jgi:cytochrome oxidase assembly protein ShyY1
VAQRCRVVLVVRGFQSYEEAGIQKKPSHDLEP